LLRPINANSGRSETGQSWKVGLLITYLADRISIPQGIDRRVNSDGAERIVKKYIPP